MQEKIKIKDRKHFREKYLTPALKMDIVQPVGVYNPHSKTQKYKLTQKGIQLQKSLKNN
jgi:ATP-dependent DNA helicase RecG